MSPIVLILLIALVYLAYSRGLFGSGTTTTPPAGGGGPLPPGTPFHFSTAGDFRDNSETATNLAANSPSLVVLLGDYSYGGDPEGWWSGNMSAINGLDVIGCLGNHDDGEGGGFNDLWPLNNGQWEFIHKISNVAFVCINSGSCSDSSCAEPSTSDSLLAQAEADPEVAHIIPFMHKTVFTPTSNDISPDAPTEYHDIFAKYSKVRMVLGGHNHWYARMNPVSGTAFPYVTVGNGGANPHDDGGEGTSPTQQFVRSNGCLHCDVNNDTISCQMISNEGLVWDEFTITPGSPPPASDQDPAQAGSVSSEDENDADQASLATVSRVLMSRFGET